MSKEKTARIVLNKNEIEMILQNLPQCESHCYSDAQWTKVRELRLRLEIQLESL